MLGRSPAHTSSASTDSSWESTAHQSAGTGRSPSPISTFTTRTPRAQLLLLLLMCFCTGRPRQEVETKGICHPCSHLKDGGCPLSPAASRGFSSRKTLSLEASYGEGGIHLGLGQMECPISTVALIMRRDIPEALCGITPVLPRVWEAYMWEVRKDPLMLEAHSSFNLQARSGLSFQPQPLGPMDNQHPWAGSCCTCSNLFMWNGK